MDDSTRRGGLTIKEYERHVWDMARHQLHPTFLYVAAEVAGATRLLAHPLYAADGGGLREVLLFLGGFLGAWGCFYSTLLRVSGFRSLTVTVIVPAAALAALAIWFVLPSPDAMSHGTLAAAEAALVVPGVVAWALTMRRWRTARREAESAPHAGTGS